MHGIINRWESSGLSQKAFCKVEGINYYKFKYWKTQYQNEQKLTDKNQVDVQKDFIALEIPNIKTLISGIEINFPNGVKLCCDQGLEPNQLSELIKLF